MKYQRITYRTDDGNFKLIEAAATMNNQELINYIAQLERKVYPELEFEKGQKVFHVEHINQGSTKHLYVVREDKISRASQLIDGTPRYRLSKAKYTVGGDYLFTNKAEADKKAAKLNELDAYKNTLYSAYDDCTIVPQTEFKDNDYRLAYESTIKSIGARDWKVHLHKTFTREVNWCLERVQDYGDKIIETEEGTNRYRIQSLVRDIKRLETQTKQYNIEAKRYNHFVEVFKPEGVEKVPAKLKVDKTLVAYAAKLEKQLA